MRTRQLLWNEEDGWVSEPPEAAGSAWNLLLCFWSAPRQAVEKPLARLRELFPQALVLGCSTAGEIHRDRVLDGSLSVTCVCFDLSAVEGGMESFTGSAESREAGQRLGRRLLRDDLRHVFVLSRGLDVNGSELALGFASVLPEHVSLSGGLAGDGARFKRTWVLWGDEIRDDCVAAVGLYGNNLCIGTGSRGGWDVFGPERLITRSEGNVLMEMDGENALELYEKYLGGQASGLPATGLLFPLSIRQEGSEHRLVRTILGVDREKKTLTFAGDVPEGAYARLMKANFNRLVDGAVDAAGSAADCVRAERGLNGEPDLAILISCVGRKLILKQMVEEEVESVADTLGADTPLSGFYSYGELAPRSSGEPCELHNQTMTVTTISER